MLLKNKRGFTLIEIMTVVAIVSALLAVAMLAGAEFKKQANEANCQVNLKTIATGFELYATRHGGVYAAQEENNLQFLVNDGCLHQDLVGIGQIGNFRYISGSVNASGYDIRAMAVNSALANHNYQITTGSLLRRSDTSSPDDTNFKSFR